MDDKAKCPVCGEIITFTTPAKLHRSIICFTCLTNLQVVELDPLELETLDQNRRSMQPLDSHHHKKSAKKNKKRGNHEHDEYEDLDDYVLEKRLRRKPNRDKRHKEKGWDG